MTVIVEVLEWTLTGEVSAQRYQRSGRASLTPGETRMHQDRFLKLILAVIGLGLWALAFAVAQLSAAPARAGSDSGVTASTPVTVRSLPRQGVADLATLDVRDERPDAQDPARSGVESRDTTPGPATEPLRWFVGHASEATGATTTYCTTTVVVNNRAPGAVVIQVEWFRYDGLSYGYSGKTLSADNSYNFWADTDVNPSPFGNGISADLGAFVGYATVHADDPRILVSAYVVCRDGTGTAAHLIGVSEVAAFPVGETLDYFQAGSPQSDDGRRAFAESPVSPAACSESSR
jgi:hypothetical protein